MKPIYKWTGGKRKDIKHFEKYFPEYIKNNNKYTLIEPFFGGGAVYWHLENDDNIINDIDSELINFLNILKEHSDILFDKLNYYSIEIEKITEQEKLNKIGIKESKIERGKFYYELRNQDRNNGLKNLNKIDRAVRFYLVNQLSFNGMRRFNSRGEFNVPYGNYKKLNIQFKDIHLNLLNNTQIYCDTYENIIKKVSDNTFVFLDPPYTREFKEYSHDNIFGYKEQMKLSEFIKKSDCDIMLIINKDNFTEELYNEYIIDEYDFNYSTNIKNRYSNDVKHLIITNYK